MQIDIPELCLLLDTTVMITISALPDVDEMPHAMALYLSLDCLKVSHLWYTSISW